MLMSKFNNITLLLAAVLLGACQSTQGPVPEKSIEAGQTIEAEARVETEKAVETESAEALPSLETQPKPKPETIDTIQWIYLQAIDSLKSGNTEFALELLAQVSADAPDETFVFTNLGLAYFKLQKPDLAETAFREAIERNSRDAVAHNHLGILERRKGRFNEARDSYRRATEINSEYAAAYLNLGILFDIYLQDLEQALRFYRKYQALISEENSQVAGWIVDIERRLKPSGVATRG